MGEKSKTPKHQQLHQSTSRQQRWRRLEQASLAVRPQRCPVAVRRRWPRCRLLQWDLVPWATSGQQSQQRWRRQDFLLRQVPRDIGFGCADQPPAVLTQFETTSVAVALGFRCSIPSSRWCLKRPARCSTGLQICSDLVPQKTGRLLPLWVGSAAAMLLGSCLQVQFSQRRQDGRVSSAVVSVGPFFCDPAVPLILESAGSHAAVATYF